MSRSLFIVIVLAIFVAVGATIYEARVMASQEKTLLAEQQRIARLENEVSELRRLQTATGRELEAGSERQSAVQAHAATHAATSHPAAAADVDAWLARVKRLKASFAEHRDQAIPELSLLTDLDWLALGRRVALDSDQDRRAARAEAREAAFQNFRAPLAQALRKFATQADGAFLNDVAQLQPYFSPPIDPAILARYEVRGRPDGARWEAPNVTERAAVDADLDTRHHLMVQGNGGGAGPWAAEPLRQASMQAYRDFAAANGRPIRNDSELLPYMRDPVARAIFEATAAYEKTHQGKAPKELTELRAYLTDPAARVLVEKIASARQDTDSP
jgi:hypothetical protein